MMMFHIVVLLTLGPSMCVVTALITHNHYGLNQPKISTHDLRSTLSSDQPQLNLHKILYDSRGILRISVNDDYDKASDYFSNLRKRALGNLCDCPTMSSKAAFAKAAILHPKDLQQITLPDGTKRRTLASATIGFDENSAGALELPSWVKDNCGQEAYHSFEELRDAVAQVVELFISRLDQERNESGRGKDNVDEGGPYQSYRQILSDTNHLEHFHVYTKLNNEESKQRDLEEVESSTLDYHTDAGFFLSYVPAMNCRSRTTDNSSFFLKGIHESLDFEEDEVLIMMGAGAQYWLAPLIESKEKGFLAASHALRLTHGTHRVWYGKMHLLPSLVTPINNDDSALLRNGDTTGTHLFELKDYDAHVPSSPVDGCGTMFRTLKQSRRRLQHVNSPSQCNNHTNFFCWYQCIDIPSSDLAEQFVQDGFSLYCLNPAFLSSSLLDATEPCQGGFVHNSHCVGSWQKADPRVSGYPLPYEATMKENNSSSTSSSNAFIEMDMGDQYCYGGTSMYMDGFTWQDTTCVIYLFSFWVLSTPGKFATAALGSILLGVALEFVLWKRRCVYALPSGRRRLILSTTIYGLQLAMGYLIMLVIMTYSGPLFVSTVGGMMLGHLLFNAQDSFASQWRAKCNRTEMNGETYRTDMNGDSSLEANSLFLRRRTNSNRELNSYQHEHHGLKNVASRASPSVIENEKFPATESTTLRSVVADGATPCCQYTL